MELVKGILEANYFASDIDTLTIEDTSEGSYSEHSVFWEMLGVKEKYNESSTTSELDDFIKLSSGIRKDTNPLQWWFTNR